MGRHERTAAESLAAPQMRGAGALVLLALACVLVATVADLSALAASGTHDRAGSALDRSGAGPAGPQGEGGVASSASAPPSGSPRPSARQSSPAALQPVLDSVRGTSRRVGSGRLVTYSVEVQRGLPVDPVAFAGAVEQILYAPRSWTATGKITLQRVPAAGAQFRVALASPAVVDEHCRPLSTRGKYSCFNGTRAMINSVRWAGGAEAYGRDLAGYRTYLINHEVGHALDNRHARCPARGALAPVMVQQTISTHGCRPNPWPYPDGAVG